MGARLSHRGELDRIDAFSEWPALTAPGETCGSPVSYPGIQQFFTLHVLLRRWNTCTSPVQKHTWIHLQLWVTFSDSLSLSSLLENIQCLEKALSPEVTHLLTHTHQKKNPVSPCFLFIGQGWFICFLHPAHIHVIKKTSSRCSDIWSSMNSWKGSWGFPRFEEQMKSQSRGSRKLGFLYSPPNNLFQLGWGFEGKGKTILVFF